MSEGSRCFRYDNAPPGGRANIRCFGEKPRWKHVNREECRAFTLPELAARDATNIVQWSDEDGCYVAQFDLGGGLVSAHGPTREEAWKEFQTALALTMESLKAAYVKRGHEEAASVCVHLANLIGERKSSGVLMQAWETIRALSPAVPALEEVRRKVLEEVAVVWNTIGCQPNGGGELFADWLQRALIGKGG